VDSSPPSLLDELNADVVIIGAGPAGTAAAIPLAEAGLNVTVIDKARFPRDKFCGDGLTSGCLRIFEELGLDPANVPSWKSVDDIYIQSPSGRRAYFPMPTGRGQFAAVATREDLDAALVDLARSKGATILEGHEVTDIVLTEQNATVFAHGLDPIVCSFVIGADGMWSNTRKILGLGEPKYRGEWHAFRQYWKNVSPRATQELHVWFEPDVLPGYVWCFPLADGRANVGFGVHRSTHAVGDMNRYWPQILERPHIREILGPDAEPDGPHRAWPIPARLGNLALTAHRTLFVGDAAAACDPMTGEGIAQALETGIEAAKSIIAAGPGRPLKATQDYEERINKALAVDLRFAGWLGGLLRTPVGARMAVRGASFSPWAARNFGRWLFEDYPRAILGTPSRWTTDMFTRPGSFQD